MTTVKDNKSNKIYTLLANVPTSLIWKFKVLFTSVFWLLSTSETKKTWNEFYYGLIKHDCDYDYTKLEGDKYKHHSCKHYGCNIVSFELPSDEIFDMPEVDLKNPLEEFYYYERPPYLKSDQKDFKERLQKALNYLKGN